MRFTCTYLWIIWAMVFAFNLNAQSSGPCAGGTTITYHETTYNLVELGGDCWFASDLQTENLNTGQSVPDYGNHVFNTAQPWDPSGGPQRVPSSGTGFSYNYYAIITDALCPKGWHVPTVDDVNNAAGDAGFSAAFASGGYSWDTDYGIATDGAWAIATTPGPGAVTVFDSNGTMWDSSSDNSGANTRCVKD